MRIVDLFCCGGGATKGMQDAGHHVTGVDINSQPKYCGDDFIQGDALTVDLSDFDFVWASPPCQAHTAARHSHGREYLDLIPQTREKLISSGKPYIIENVPGAPLLRPVLLCGSMFDLRVYRHRLFESNVELKVPFHPYHKASVCKMGRPPKQDEFIQVVGHFSDVPAARVAMGIDWLGQKELAQAIPPAYSNYLVKQI